MKSDLKRIEATLQHLALGTADYPKPAATRTHAPQTRRSYSFEISSAAQKRNPPEIPSEGTLTSSNSQLPTQQSADKEPVLPKFNSSTSRVHSGSNPALEIEHADAVASDAELQQVVRQIKALYMEGPIVDGWLESYQFTPESPVLPHELDERLRDGVSAAISPEPAVTSSKNVTLSHESVTHRINYLQEVCSFEQEITCESPRAGYRLCGLDTAGQKWSRPCPLEQLPNVSIAIARYQKLQQLLERKHYFDRFRQENTGEATMGKEYLRP